MSLLQLNIAVEQHVLADPFRISGHVFHSADVIVVTLADGFVVGRGEAAGVYYLGDNSSSMSAAIESARSAIESGVTREELRSIMPPCGARNAVDAALWELESKRSGKPVWELAGGVSPRPLITTFTLSADEPDAMAMAAQRYDHAKSIKVKLTGELDLDVKRVRAVRAARPSVWLGVDANQGFDINELDALVLAMHDIGVSLIEQPLARGLEVHLDGYSSLVPIAADESVQTLNDVSSIARFFDVINIKLDKCGGLTEALLMASAARAAGMRVMVGNMLGTSLAMAPAFVLGQVCDLVDLDGPIFLKEDRVPGLTYRDGEVWCAEAVWGAEIIVT